MKCTMIVRISERRQKRKNEKEKEKQVVKKKEASRHAQTL